MGSDGAEGALMPQFAGDNFRNAGFEFVAVVARASAVVNHCMRSQLLEDG